MMLNWTRAVAGLVFALATVVGCSDSTEPLTPDLPAVAIAELAAVTPTTVTGTVGAAIDPSPSVRVIRREGRMPMMGVPVTFEFTTGQSTTQRVVYTDGEGVASAAWALGTTAGTHRVTATSSATGSASIVFTATASPGPVASAAPYINQAWERGSGGMQSAPVASTLPYPLSLIVRDQFNNAISGATVTFTVLSGGGSIGGATAVTSSTGVASSGPWTLGATPGTQQVRARVGTVDLVFTAEACMTTCAATGQLAFVRSGNIYRMLLDGTVIQLTTMGNNNHPAWSPDGRRIAFTRYDGSDPDIFIMNADGSNVVRRTSGADFHSPAWSPDGRTLAAARGYIYHGDIYLMSAVDDGAAPTWLAGSAVRPAWSPDGKQIAYVELSGDDGYDRIGVMNSDGSQARSVTPPAGGADRPTWSPDGKQIAFADWKAGMSQVYVVNADGSGLRSVTHPTFASGAAWAPDGNRIAYALSAQPGVSGSAIMFVTPEGVGPTMLINNASSPAWAP